MQQWEVKDHMKEIIQNLPPWNISYKHPISILVFISWHILGTIQKIYQFAFIHEIFRSLWATVTFKEQKEEERGG